ncbi:MAG: hypothetical protein P8186_30300 [Anaerolineae bacterium]
MKLDERDVLERAELSYARGEKPMLRGHDLSGLGLYRVQLPEADSARIANGRGQPFCY